MSLDHEAMRSKLVARIESMKAVQQSMLDIDGKSHIHNYKKFKKTIRPDADKFTGRAYFIVMACEGCKESRIVDYVIEK